MAPKNLNFRMAIPEEFRDKWASFNNQAKIEEITTAELLKDLIEDYLEEFDGAFDKINVESVSNGQKTYAR
jgi:hypothetical protein